MMFFFTSGSMTSNFTNR